MTTETCHFTVSGIKVEVVRKDIKNLHLGVYPPHGRVRVAAPLVVNDEAVRLPDRRRRRQARRKDQHSWTVTRRVDQQRDGIQSIIGLPANLFYGTGIPACILVLDKEGAAGRKGIFMIDASKGFIKDGNKNRLRAQDNISYSNFKSTVKERDRHDVYMGVWSGLYSYQERGR